MRRERNPFELMVHEASLGLRPRYWFLRNTLEGNEGCAQSWGEGLGDESAIVLRRWGWLKETWGTWNRAAREPELIADPETFGRLLGQRGDAFSAWLECGPGELVEWLEQYA